MSDCRKPFYKNIWFWIALLICALFIFSSISNALDSSRSSLNETNQPTSKIVYITRTGEKYHRESCRYLNQSKISIELNEAIKRGYTPCSVCKP